MGNKGVPGVAAAAADDEETAELDFDAALLVPDFADDMMNDRPAFNVTGF